MYFTVIKGIKYEIAVFFISTLRMKVSGSVGIYKWNISTRNYLLRWCSDLK